MPEVDIKGLFPTPFMRVSDALPVDLVRECVRHIDGAQVKANAKSTRLHHTEIVDPRTVEPFRRVTDRVTPHLVRFGRLLFGEDLDWFVKELWTNLLQPGGYQSPHSHSNSFISAVAYLTDSDPSARTVFHRGIGGQQFIFNNENENAQMGPFNGTKWVSPDCRAGDLVLFPSYLLHEVPRNEGARRISIAMNAIPDRLDTWGYSVRFSSQRRG